jgi:choline dehydrogenase
LRFHNDDRRADVACPLSCLLWWQDLNLEGVMAAKALGGCGIHNAMLYVRAIPADFEEWNLTNWDWATALKTYKQLEDWIGDDASYHGKGGPIRTR